MKTIEDIHKAPPATNAPEFRPGDTVRVHVRILEGDKERGRACEPPGRRRVGRVGGLLQRGERTRNTSEGAGVRCL